MHVGSGYEMKRGAEGPGPDNRTISNRLLYFRLRCCWQAETNCPERSEIILSLHGAERGHHFRRLSTWGSRDLLIGQPQPRYIARGHYKDLAPTEHNPSRSTRACLAPTPNARANAFDHGLPFGCTIPRPYTLLAECIAYSLLATDPNHSPLRRCRSIADDTAPGRTVPADGAAPRPNI